MSCMLAPHASPPYNAQASQNHPALRVDTEIRATQGEAASRKECTVEARCSTT